MLETVIAIASGAVAIAEEVGPVLGAANAAFGLYKNISAIGRGGSSTEHYLDKLAVELGELRLQIERLSDSILYLPKVEGVRDLNLRYQQSVRDLREVREYLDPIQQALGQEIVSSSMISTPERLLQVMRKSPWDVLYNIRPVHYAEPSTDPSSVPVLFHDRGVAYIGWIKRGSLPGMFDCEYNELWLPSLQNKPKPQIESPLQLQKQREKKEEVELRSKGGVDYTKLRDLLAAENWKEADEETARVMLQAARRQKQGWLSIKDIDKFPCEDLRTIDKLWLYYSNGHFGFSVQKDIYQSLRGTKEYDKFFFWDELFVQVGWRSFGPLGRRFAGIGQWIPKKHLTFYACAAPRGHLPAWAYVVRRRQGYWTAGLIQEEVISFAQKLVICNV